MPLGKNTHRLGNLTEEDINFPKHLTPEIVHAALFVHNAHDKAETITRVKYCTKQMGEQAMSYAMAILVLPYLMDKTKNSTEYKEWKEQTKPKKLN